MKRTRRVSRFCLSFFVLAATQGCAFSNIDLVKDTRISIVSPHDGQTVTLPFVLQWRVNSTISPDAGAVSYAVFVDRTVIKAGATLRSVVPSSDFACLNNPHCPDAAYLAERGIYLADSTHFMLTGFPGIQTKKKQSHTLSVVILVNGHRDGEGAFTRTVYVEQG